MARTGQEIAPRKPASNRSTSGLGYSYEDLVAAAFLAGALVGEKPLGLKAATRSIHFQTRASGWFIDDLLITTVQGEHAAVSCKSGVKVGRDRLPTDFVTDVRAQWAEPGPFSRARDLLVHVSQRAHVDFIAAWSDIRAWRSEDDPDYTLARIQAEARPYRLLQSLAEDNETAQSYGSGRTLLEVLDRIEVLQLDLLQSNSRDRAAAVLKCQQALVDGYQEEAERLWNALIERARTARLGTGILLVDDVWRVLSADFLLRDQPDKSADWSKLEALSRDQRDACETTLPLGLTLPRDELALKIVKPLQVGGDLHVYGDSGVGKSALVKSTLDQWFPDRRQIWLGPETLGDLLTEAGRAARGLSTPVAHLLKSSASPANILVLDAIEKLDGGRLPALQRVLDDLKSDGAWRVILISQADGTALARRGVMGHRDPITVEVEPLKVQEVQSLLATRREFGWLSSDPSLLVALTNPRVLGWVIEAGATSTPGTFVSHTAVADYLWRQWTGGKVAIEGLIIRLAEREAEFERSFALSAMTADDQQLLDQIPVLLPLLRGPDNRYRFGHDLVADWARFQKLKEEAELLDRWAPLAAHPSWVNALRLMAQDLLRRQRGDRSAWDVMLEAAEAAGQMTAVDVLLDALALDPHADLFLKERAETLLADDGKRLNRLLRRFHHVATTSMALATADIEPTVKLYMEARYRQPIVGRWGPIARFLETHTKAIASLMSPAATTVCHTWLAATPLTYGEGQAFPYRQSFARLALASAREVQIAKAANVIFADGGAREIFEAALKGAEDIPDEIAAWVLEMSERRPASDAVIQGVAVRRRRSWQEIKARMRADPVFKRKRLERRGHRAERFPFSERDLPPWPLGASRRIDHDFRRVCVRGGGLTGLMRSRPELAAEALLALIVEDQPRERSYTSGLMERWGLEYEADDNPLPPPLRSPFYAFLLIAPDVAIEAAIRLIDFCMERWTDEKHRFEQGIPEAVTIDFDGEPRAYLGDFQVLQWSRGEGAGQLTNLFAAIEKWLCGRLELNEDISPVLASLLKDGRSVAFLVLALNIGKFRPSLFRDVLRPLLGDVRIYMWDRQLAEQCQFSLDGLRLMMFGAESHDACQDWATASYRHESLTTVAIGEARIDPVFAAWLATRAASWEHPDDAKASLELDWLKAAVDPANYAVSAEGGLQFLLPKTISDSIEAHTATLPEDQSRRQFVGHLADALKNGGPISDEDAAWAASLMQNAPDEDVEQRAVDLACGGVLLALAPEWIGAKPELRRRCVDMIRRRALDIPVDWETIHASKRTYDPELEIVAWTVARLWSANPDEDDLEGSILALALVGGAAASVVVGVACRHRQQLGDRWLRLLQILSWRVALSGLAPHFPGDGPLTTLWERRMRWLRARSLVEPSAEVDFSDLQTRVARLNQRRSRRRLLPDHWRPPFNDHLLEIYFGWVAEIGESDEEIDLLLRCWGYALEQQKRKADDRSLAYPLNFQRRVIQRLAILSVTRTDGLRFAALILEAGPRARHAVSLFMSHLFFRIEELDPLRFVSVWHYAINYSLTSPVWSEGGRWYDREALLREILGFEVPTILAKLPDLDRHMTGMAELYRHWADDRLVGSSDNLAGLARFLASRAGNNLRAEGVLWIATAIETENGLGYWSRHDNVGEALAGMIDVVIVSLGVRIRTDRVFRDAVVSIVGELIKRQIEVGLVLRERLKALDEGAHK